MPTEYTNEMNGSVIQYPSIVETVNCRNLTAGDIITGAITVTDSNGNVVQTDIDTITTVLAYVPDPEKNLKISLTITFEEI